MEASDIPIKTELLEAAAKYLETRLAVHNLKLVTYLADTYKKAYWLAGSIETVIGTCAFIPFRLIDATECTDAWNVTPVAVAMIDGTEPHPLSRIFASNLGKALHVKAVPRLYGLVQQLLVMGFQAFVHEGELYLYLNDLPLQNIILELKTPVCL